MSLEGKGTCIRTFIPGITYDDLTHFGCQSLDDVIVERSVNKYAGGRLARLPCVSEVHAPHGHGRGKGGVSPFGDDEGVLATQFKRYVLNVRRSRFEDSSPSGNTPGKPDSGNRGMCHDCRAGLVPVSRDHVENARREYLSGDLRKCQGRKGRLLRRLDNNSVACEERWGSALYCKHQWVIERHDSRDDTERLAHRVGERV